LLAGRRTLDRGSNMLSMSFERSTASRYALLEVSGLGRAPGALQPPFVPSFPGETRPRAVAQNRIGRATDGPNNADGTGGDFIHPKRLFVVSEALSIDEATREARRTMARGLANARTVEVTAPGHGQLVEGALAPTLFAPDTIATVYKEIEKGPGDDSAAVLVEARFYVTHVRFSSARDQEQTEVSLIPLGTELV